MTAYEENLAAGRIDGFTGRQAQPEEHCELCTNVGHTQAACPWYDEILAEARLEARDYGAWANL